MSASSGSNPATTPRSRQARRRPRRGLTRCSRYWRWNSGSTPSCNIRPANASVAASVTQSRKCSSSATRSRNGSSVGWAGRSRRGRRPPPRRVAACRASGGTARGVWYQPPARWRRRREPRGRGSQDGAERWQGLPDRCRCPRAAETARGLLHTESLTGRRTSVTPLCCNRVRQA